jgi:transcriptional coactivator p15 (PC4)
LTEEIRLGSIEKNEREEIRISLSVFKGRSLLNIRVWFKDKRDEMHPSRKGVAIRVDQIPELARLIRDAYLRADELPALGPAKSEGRRKRTQAMPPASVEMLLDLLDASD